VINYGACSTWLCCWCCHSGDECRKSFWRVCRQLSIDEYNDMYKVQTHHSTPSHTVTPVNTFAHGQHSLSCLTHVVLDVLWSPLTWYVMNVGLWYLIISWSRFSHPDPDPDPDVPVVLWPDLDHWTTELTLIEKATSRCCPAVAPSRVQTCHPVLHMFTLDQNVCPSTRVSLRWDRWIDDSV